jgi:hypothetical protein
MSEAIVHLLEVVDVGHEECCILRSAHLRDVASPRCDGPARLRDWISAPDIRAVALAAIAASALSIDQIVWIIRRGKATAISTSL